MKVLFLCDGMAFEINDKTKPITSGYSYLVRDLMSSFAEKRGNSAFCYSKNLEPQRKEWKGVRLLKRSPLRIVRHAKPFYARLWATFAKRMQLTAYEYVYLLYAYLEGGLIEYIIHHGNFDLVSIQGVTKLTVPYILACERLGIKYCISFHSLDFSRNGYSDGGQYAAKWILETAARKGIPTSFISTGMYLRACEMLDVSSKKPACFKVILNGFSKIEPLKENIRLKYDIPSDAIVGLCCANITERKNQIQIVRAYNLLPKEIQGKLYILFIGREGDCNVRKEIERTHESKHLIICGTIDHSRLAPYFDAANFGIVSSLSEGFGLSILESFSFGIPVVTWSDLDAVDDLYFEKAMVKVDERSDKALADGIKKVATTQWGHDEIVEYSRSFSMESMVSKYEEWFLSQVQSK